MSASADSRYDDMLALPHHVSRKHPPMSLHDRAAQFSPFAALTGYEDAIEETARLTEQRVELDEEAKSRLNHRLEQLLLLPQRPEASFTYFQPDERKSGGAYVTHTGLLKKIDTYERIIRLEDGFLIPLDELFAVDSPLLSED